VNFGDSFSMEGGDRSMRPNSGTRNRANHMRARLDLVRGPRL
jgi:hypothetical protein